MVTKSFSHTAECELEVHCSPFGLSGLYVKLQGSDAVGIGSTMARLTGFTTGKLHYNNPEDLIGSKFKLYGLVEDNDILRIDFIKIFTEVQALTTKEKGEDLPFEEPEDEGYEIPDLVFRGKVPAGRPDVVEPFIGIFNFEKPPNAD